MFELVPHTADVRLRVSAPALEELFVEAVRGMYAVMRAHPGETPVEHSIVVEDSADTTSLLVDFLNEVLRRAHIAREMYTGVVVTKLDATSIEARVSGAAPASFEEDVKAVTYHEAEVVRGEDGWTTMLVFDL